MEQVLFDGVALTDWYDVIGVTRPLATPTPTVQYVQGGNRNHVRGVELVPPEISFTVLTRSMRSHERREVARQLAEVLLVGEPVKVQFSSDYGRYYMAVPTGALDLHEFVTCGTMAVTLLAVEAAMYGEAASATSSGGTATVRVGGTYRTALKVEAASATRNSSTKLWGVRADGGDFVHVEVPTASSSKVSVDSGAREARVNGALSLPTLDSDWLVVEPGTHAIARDQGAGEFTVSWTERWL